MNFAERTILWLLASGLAVAAVAWTAFQAQQEGIAPAVLFPLAVGAAIGGSTVAVARWLQIDRPWLVVIAAGCCGLLAVLGQDYVAHRHRLRAYDEAIARQSPLATIVAGAADFRPTLGEHLSGKVRGAPVWWTLDLLLTAGGAVAIAVLVQRKRHVPAALCSGEERLLEGNLK